MYNLNVLNNLADLHKIGLIVHRCIFIYLFIFFTKYSISIIQLKYIWYTLPLHFIPYVYVIFLKVFFITVEFYSIFNYCAVFVTLCICFSLYFNMSTLTLYYIHNQFLKQVLSNSHDIPPKKLNIVYNNKFIIILLLTFSDLGYRTLLIDLQKLQMEC